MFLLRFLFLLRKDPLCPSDRTKDEFLDLLFRVAGMQTDTQAACRNRGWCYWTGVNAQREEMRREGPRHRGHKRDNRTRRQRGVLVSEMGGK